MITLRPMTEDDFARFWPTYRTVVAAQETYALDPA
ncbi:GNAT family N-acetyltransferase, partial [Burkholderia multivorans]